MNIEEINDEYAKIIIEKVSKHIAAQFLMDRDMLYMFLGEDFVDTIPVAVYSQIEEHLMKTGARWLSEDGGALIDMSNQTFPQFVSELLSKSKDSQQILLALNNKLRR